MKHSILFLTILALFITGPISVDAQTFPTDDPIVKKIWAEAVDSSQLEILAHELLDVIGPRLVGSPQMLKANDWAVKKLGSWNVEARNEQYGTWKGWERGVTHIDLLEIVDLRWQFKFFDRDQLVTFCVSQRKYTELELPTLVISLKRHARVCNLCVLLCGSLNRTRHRGPQVGVK